MATASVQPAASSAAPASAMAADSPVPVNQYPLLDFFFPGFSMFSAAINNYLHIDLTVYLPVVLALGAMTFAWRYFSDYISGLVRDHLMSTVDIRIDDEVYNIFMAWVKTQSFAQRSRKFVAQTSVASRSWVLWWRHDDDDDEEDGTVDKKRKAISYTPSFGSHFFWWQGNLMLFRREQNTEKSGYMTASEREEISLSCFGRNPAPLKELLLTAREEFVQRDERKTLIYRAGNQRFGGSSPSWQRTMARDCRPFSTVILDDKIKQGLIDDIAEYLDPDTRRWYANRGIPFRRGYLLHGPPGTGKSSISLALAGYFHLRIYICSLTSPFSSEEDLANLFSELPRRCIVLLEDIDSAGLTNTREGAGANESSSDSDSDDSDDESKKKKEAENEENKDRPNKKQKDNQNRLSLSGLLNILDGVASQEGRILIMTTNHLEKLDRALLRPGRVDMTVHFGLADESMIKSIFRAIYAPLKEDENPESRAAAEIKFLSMDPEKQAEVRAERARKRETEVARVADLADQFAAKVPAFEFSPAELQGLMLKNKRDPETVVSNAETWVEETRKEKKAKELKEAEKKRKQEAKNKRKEEKKKEEEEKKKKEEEGEKGDDKKKKDGSGTDGSSSESESESDSEAEKKARKSKKAKAKKRRSKHRKSKADESSSDDESAPDADSESDAETRKGKSKKGKSKKGKDKAADATASDAESESDHGKKAKSKAKSKAKKNKAKDKKDKKDKTEKKEKKDKDSKAEIKQPEPETKVDGDKAEDKGDKTAKAGDAGTVEKPAESESGKDDGCKYDAGKDDAGKDEQSSNSHSADSSKSHSPRLEAKDVPAVASVYEVVDKLDAKAAAATRTSPTEEVKNDSGYEG